ncbi:MAG: CvpA family protein [Flavisolibacter sp.]|jgi:membrane protein required for colicin V production
MLIDIVVLILAFLALYKGFRKGFVLAIFSLLSFIIGLAAALKLSALVAIYLGKNINVAQRWLPFLAFILVFIFVIIIVRLGAKAIQGLLEMAMLGWLNRVLGVLLYLILYFFIFSIILFYAVQMHLIKQATIDASVTYPVLAPFGPRVVGWLSEIIPVFENMFLELKKFFGDIS